MATVREFELDVDTGKAEKNVDDLAKSIDKLAESISDSNKETVEGLKDVEAVSKETAGGVKKIGGAIKAAGIGLAIAAFTQLKEVFSQNQKVADAFSTAFEFISLAFNDFFKFIDSNVSVVVDFFKAIFEDPKQAVKDLGTAITNNLIERFESLLDMLGFLGSALIKVFSGDFKGALEDANSASAELFDVVTGVDDSFNKVVETTKKVIGGVVEYTKATVKSAAENVQLARTAEMASVANQGLIEKYDLQAEKLRQVRDEERNTIAERKKANDDLNAVLDEQEKAMLANANAILATAQAQFNKNGNDENAIALMEAKNELVGVEAQIAGFRSEQKANDLALDREQLELNESLSAGEAERNKAQSEFTAEQIENDVLRLQTQLENAQAEKLIEEKRLETKRDLYKEGTQAYVDANNELLAYSQENANNQIQIERDLNKAKGDAIMGGLSGIADLVGKESKYGKAIAVVQAIRDTYAGATKALAQGGIFGAIGAAGIVASGIANVRTIAATPDPEPPAGLGGGGTGGGSSIPALPSPPAFNIVGQTGTNQLADAIASQTQSPVKAYVVASDVTTGQSLDRNIIEGASL
tara:strand:+ start:546 stop:2303 length:1758 start_codon:yes stop_codon:yes gene_type:complete